MADHPDIHDLAAITNWVQDADHPHLTAYRIAIAAIQVAQSTGPPPLTPEEAAPTTQDIRTHAYLTAGEHDFLAQRLDQEAEQIRANARQYDRDHHPPTADQDRHYWRLKMEEEHQRRRAARHREIAAELRAAVKEDAERAEIIPPHRTTKS